MKSGDLEQEDQNLKCYLKCFMMRHGILDKNAKVDVQRALRHLPRSLQDSSKKLFNKCKSTSKFFSRFSRYREKFPDVAIGYVELTVCRGDRSVRQGLRDGEMLHPTSSGGKRVRIRTSFSPSAHSQRNSRYRFCTPSPSSRALVAVSGRQRSVREKKKTLYRLRVIVMR